MILRFMLACALISGAAGTVHSQTAQKTNLLPKRWKEISIGETLPDVMISGFLDDSTRQVRLSDLYRDKLLILDFWATWCTGCLQEFPESKKLKQKLGKNLDFLLVSYESRNKVVALNKRTKLFDDGVLQTITADSVLHEMFPHRMVPHYVWINSAGRVIAITSADQLTVEKISKAIAGEVKVRVKKDIMDFNFGQPFHLKDTSFLFRSILTTGVDGIFSSSSIPNADSIDRIFMSNRSIAQLYCMAAFRYDNIAQVKDRLFISTRDSLRYFDPIFAPLSFKTSKYKERPDWKDENLYCYDLKFPRRVSSFQMMHYMIDDLNRYFNLDGHFEKRKLPCLVLEGKGNRTLLAATENEKPGIFAYRDGGLLIKRQSMLTVAEAVGRYMQISRVVDETHIDVPVSIDLPGLKDNMDLENVNTVLKPFGLHFKIAVRPIDVFVVNERHE